MNGSQSEKRTYDASKRKYVAEFKSQGIGSRNQDMPVVEASTAAWNYSDKTTDGEVQAKETRSRSFLRF